MQFVAASLYLLFVSFIASALTERPLPVVLLGIVLGSLFCSAVALVWLIRAASQKEGRPGQFGIASLLLTTVFLAVYFSIVRWLAVHLKIAPGGADNAALLIPVAMMALLFVLLSVPFVAYMTESLIWFAVWIVRRRFVQRLVVRRRRETGE